MESSGQHPHAIKYSKTKNNKTPLKNFSLSLSHSLISRDNLFLFLSSDLTKKDGKSRKSERERGYIVVNYNISRVDVSVLFFHRLGVFFLLISSYYWHTHKSHY